MSVKQKIKNLIINHLIIILTSFSITMTSAYLLSEKILPNFKTLWFLLFFIGFMVFMGKIVSYLKVNNLGRRFLDDKKI